MSNTPYPDDEASLPQAESTEEELAHRTSDENCYVCQNLRQAVPESIKTTYAELQRTAAGGCELCELLWRICEAGYIRTGMPPIQGTENISVFTGNFFGREGAPYLLVWTAEEGEDSGKFIGPSMFRNSPSYRLTHYKPCPNTTDRDYLSFHVASGRIYTAYKGIRSDQIDYLLTYHRRQLPMAFHDFETSTRCECESS